MKRLLLICLFWSFLSPFAKAQQLEYFITLGLKNNPLLNEYRNNVNTTAADSLLVVAMNKPQINSNTQILFAPSSSYKNFGYDDAVTNGGNYASVVDISQYFFNKRSLINKYESVNLQKQTWQNSAKISAGDLRRVITNLYLIAYADYNDLNNSLSYMELMKRHKDILKQLVSQGTYRQSDYLSLVIEVQTAEIDISRLEAQFSKDVSQLRQVCGIAESAGDTAKFSPEMPALLNALPENTDELPGTQVNSPLFKQYKIDSLKIINEQQGLNIT